MSAVMKERPVPVAQVGMAAVQELATGIKMADTLPVVAADLPIPIQHFVLKSSIHKALIPPEMVMS